MDLEKKSKCPGLLNHSPYFWCTLSILHVSVEGTWHKSPPPSCTIHYSLPWGKIHFIAFWAATSLPPFWHSKLTLHILLLWTCHNSPPHNVSLTPWKEVRSKCQNGVSDVAPKGVSDGLEGVGCCDKFLTMNCSILTVSVKNGRRVVPDQNARTFLSYWDATSLPPFLTQTVNFARFSLRNLPKKSPAPAQCIT